MSGLQYQSARNFTGMSFSEEIRLRKIQILDPKTGKAPAIGNTVDFTTWHMKTQSEI